MMPKRIRVSLAIASLSVVAILSISCGGTGRTGTTTAQATERPPILLVVESHFLFWKRANPKPDRYKVEHYGDGSTVVLVTWSYNHASTEIKFKDTDTDPTLATVCENEKGKCTLTLKGPLLKPGEDKRFLKYTISGEYEKGKKLVVHDPEIEIDR